MTGTLNKTQSGKESEELALAYLKAQGLTLVAENFRYNKGEIDLIMRDKTELVFVEVRTRDNDDYGSALESVDSHKQSILIRTAIWYLLQNSLMDKIDCRFDVVGVSGKKSNICFEWTQDAFSTDIF